MLPRLEAQQQLASIQASLAASGRMLEDRAQHGLFRELEEQAQGGRKRKKVTAADLMAMAAIGVVVIEEDEGEKGGDE
jgi:hypothetical protein